MKTQRLVTAAIAGMFGMAFLGSGCALEEDEVDEIASALELENGGLDMEDEAPFFGDETLFDEAGLNQQDEVYSDPMEDTPEVLEVTGVPDAVVYHTTLLWGQIPGNPENTTPHNWSGALHVNRGAILVRRLILFEPLTDRLLPRNDRQVVPFTSVTLPHMDGLRLAIIDPTPEVDEPMVLSYGTPNGEVYQATMADLVDGPQSLVVDDAGNRIVAVAFPRAVDVCQYGFLGGKWHRVAEGRGRIIGRVVDALGDQIGYVKGIYGRRANGARVFFGKYVNLDGEFRGIFKGHYRNGHFLGRWLHQSGDFGVLGGEYRETIPGPETGGHFLGRWAETSCNLEIPN